MSEPVFPRACPQVPARAISLIAETPTARKQLVRAEAKLADAITALNTALGGES